MKRLFKISIAALLCAVMALSMCACNSSPAAAPSASAETRTVTDMCGRTVEVPTEVSRIVPLGNTPRLISYLGLADMIVGIGDCEIADNPMQAYAYTHREAWSELPTVGTDSMGEMAYYPEEIILCAPDVILCTYTSDVADNIQKQTGIPTVAVAEGVVFSEQYDTALRVLADACGAPERAEKLIAFLHERLEDVQRRCADIPDEGKPTVLAAAATFKGGHSIDCVYNSYPVFGLTGANDVADGLAELGVMAAMVEKEKILEWDPDIIFFDAGNMGLVKLDYAESPSYFSELKAVRNGQLYQWPNSTWHYSNVEIPLVTAYYVGGVLYPEAFADVDFEATAGEIFEMFLGAPDYLAVLEAAGAGYGKVELVS